MLLFPEGSAAAAAGSLTLPSEMLLVTKATGVECLACRHELSHCEIDLGVARDQECEAIGGPTTLSDALPWIVGVVVVVAAASFAGGALMAFSLSKPNPI